MSLDPFFFTWQELRASNDDRADRDLQLDGGGISDQPVVIAVYPTAQAIRWSDDGMITGWMVGSCNKLRTLW